ncbi:hypothetical protein FB566_1777 [Stackebrandtia endophytica]|uniref:Uncharacterized protein n=1 Tax=Stackebrandtia endophytica TaxID=1496996 RepID=A0A543AUI9_9ACTN|nr:hypothetical protein [Stackebrandtia endophytica]TQL76253.1 hypothetical protein FB566_1777 [Stackebrandtia endophytica]
MSRTLGTRNRLPVTAALAVVTGTVTALTLSSTASTEPISADPPAPLEWQTLDEAPAGDLRSLAVISDDSLWTVGRDADTATASHWNGSTWTSMTVPGLRYFTATAFSADTDGWAVGDGTAHWDGSAWTSVPVDLPDTTSAWLSAVDAVGPDLAWAVGNTTLQGGGEGSAFIQQWDGTEWTLIEPTFPADYTAVDLNDIVSTGDDEAWAVGTAYRDFGSTPLIMRWDGTEWSIHDSKEMGNLTSLTVSDGELYASGFTSVDNSPVDAVPLLMHLDGADWTVVETTTERGWIYSSTADGNGGLIMAGYDSQIDRILRWNDGTSTFEEGPAGSSALNVIASAPDGESAVWLLTRDDDGWFIAYAK